MEITRELENQSQRKVPELSLNSYIQGSDTDRARFVESFFAGLRDYGFIVLKDHPIDTALLDEAYEIAQALFELPLDTKSAYAHSPGGQRGYTPFGREHAKGRTIADLKEFWHVGRDYHPGDRYHGRFPANLWPSELPRFREIFERMYRELDGVGHAMLEALTGPLGVSKSFFREMTEDGDSILRILHYPPVAPELAKQGAIRAAPHEDINFITILVSATASGLELKDRDGKWLPIESDPNSLIVDVGDMLARLTNDLLPSTTHQVVNPSGENGHRYSMPFFIHPHPNASLACLPSCRGDGAKYPDILAGAFLEQRLREIGLIK